MSEPRKGLLSLPTSDRPEVRVVVGGSQRTPGRLDLHLVDAPADPSLDDVLAAAAKYTDVESLWLAGGEPTLRRDLPRLVERLAVDRTLGMVTDGLALATPKVATMLVGLGLKRVRIRLVSSRADAHDWAVDQPGSFKRAVRGVRAALEAGLHVEIACPVTRPTRPYLAESVELFARLGVHGVLLRRVTGRGPVVADDVALLARLGLTTRALEPAVQAGVRQGLRMMVEGFPNCAAPAVADNMLATDAVVWALPSEGGWSFLEPHFALMGSEPGCARCPGRPTCCEAPTDYVRRFGRDEIDSEGVPTVRPGALPATPLAGGDVKPPARAGRVPATRLSNVRRAARMPSLSGDPLVTLRPSAVDERYRTPLVAPSRIRVAHLGDHPGPAEPETTRSARIRLVRLAQMGAQTVRIASAGTLAHPAAAELLREATRLELPRIEVAGEASALDACTDMQLRRLRGVHRVDMALFGPDAASHDAVVQIEGAFEATMRVADRLSTLVPSMEVGVYAVLESEQHLMDFAEAWDLEDLPGEPWFRLSPRGGSLNALARAAEALPAGPSREAIAAVLPISMFAREDVAPAPAAKHAWGNLPSAIAKPSGADRYGCYTDRPVDVDNPKPGECPGFAQGWSIDG